MSSKRCACPIRVLAQVGLSSQRWACSLRGEPVFLDIEVGLSSERWACSFCLNGHVVDCSDLETKMPKIAQGFHLYFWP